MTASDVGEQLPLDLRWRPTYSPHDFLVAPCNQTAHAGIEGWPNWDTVGLALWGPPGSGKSHLVEVWRRRAEAVLITGGDLATLDLRRRRERWRAVALDAVDDALGNPEFDEPLLHLFNDLVDRRGHLLIAGRRPPVQWPVGLADLRSRLNALPAIAIDAPDDQLLAALLIKHGADRQIRIGRSEIAYLLPRIDRSFAAVRQLVAAIDRAAMAQRRSVTVPLIRGVLAGLANSEGASGD